MSLSTRPNDETIDETFTVLKNSRRRWAMHVLADCGPIDRGELITQVAAIEYNTPADELDSNDRHTVYVSLQQTHFERLGEADVIERDGDTIRKGERFDDVYRFIEPDQSVLERVKGRLPPFRP